MVFALGPLLVDQKTDFVRFTFGDLSNPGAFHWGTPVSLTPQQPHYPGSMTAGADGNVSTIPLPGGFRSMISGIGVFYPDKKPTQRVGIIANREVKPTIAGIRAGRDEVLEAAIREIVGKDISADQIEKMTKH